jgi:hypothetical protein
VRNQPNGKNSRTNKSNRNIISLQVPQTFDHTLDSHGNVPLNEFIETLHVVDTHSGFDVGLTNQINCVLDNWDIDRDENTAAMRSSLGLLLASVLIGRTRLFFPIVGCASELFDSVDPLC